jgi:hypothetical protein
MTRRNFLAGAMLAAAALTATPAAAQEFNWRSQDG